MTVQRLLRRLGFVRLPLAFIPANPLTSHGLARVGKKGIMDCPMIDPPF